MGSVISMGLKMGYADATCLVSRLRHKLVSSVNHAAIAVKVVILELGNLSYIDHLSNSSGLLTP